MKTKQTKESRPGGKSEAGPCYIKTRTQLVPNDLLTGPERERPGKPTQRELEEDVVAVNPDINSMDSRG